MIKLVSLFVTYILGMIITYTYAKSSFDYKRSKKAAFAIGIISYSIVFAIYLLFPHTEPVNVAATIIANCVIIRFAFDANTKSAVFHSVILGVVQLLTEFITVYTVSAITGGDLNGFQSNEYIFMLDSIISKFIYMIICKFISVIAIKENKQITWSRYTLLAIMPLSSLIAILVVRLLTSKEDISNIMNIACIVSTIFLLLSNIVVFIVYENAQKDDQKILQMEMEQQKQEIDMAYLGLLEQKNQSMQILSHDIKNHLSIISNLAGSEEVDNYIQEIYGDVGRYSVLGKSRNKMLDLIISKYAILCDSKGIDFVVETFTENMNFVTDGDLSTLLNNLLDNAVDAAEKSTEKWVKLSFSINCMNFHTIKLENSCDKRPHVSLTGSLITTKNNKMTHGIGTKSIKKIIEKYNGEAQWGYSDEKKLFSQIIIFAIKDKTEK